MTSNPLNQASSFVAHHAGEPQASSSSTAGPLSSPPLTGKGRPGVQGEKESQMPKLKTKSGAKKRFKVTASGKVLFAQSGKRHGMIKRTTKQIREHRGTKVMFKTDGDRIKKYWLPNS
jgi:large subunit ribosomal protein L35